MLLSRAAVIWQSDGFANRKDCATPYFFAIFFSYTPFLSVILCYF